MIIGHCAVAFAASQATRNLPLWHGMIAVVWLDILHASMVILGVERAIIVPGITAVVPIDLAYYPFSHSLVASVGWSGAAYLLYILIVRRGKTAALWAAACVFSHFVLDLIAHRPDLPLFLDGGPPKLGFGMWHSRVLTFTVENLILFGTLWLYLRDPQRTQAERRGLPIVCLVGSLLFFAFPIARFPDDIRITEAIAVFVYTLVPALTCVFAHRRQTGGSTSSSTPSASSIRL